MAFAALIPVAANLIGGLMSKKSEQPAAPPQPQAQTQTAAQQAPAGPAGSNGPTIVLTAGSSATINGTTVQAAPQQTASAAPTGLPGLTGIPDPGTLLSGASGGGSGINLKSAMQVASIFMNKGQS